MLLADCCFYSVMLVRLLKRKGLNTFTTVEGKTKSRRECNFEDELTHLNQSEYLFFSSCPAQESKWEENAETSMHVTPVC